ncbi:hypothetical protein ACOSP7_021808 [Xanthoceras sorbifolium]
MGTLHQDLHFKPAAASNLLCQLNLWYITNYAHRITIALLLRFRLTDYKDPSEALIQFKQTTTVSAYEEEFEKLSHRVDELPENFLIRCFTIVLNDNIRLDVKIKQPRSLADAIAPGPKPSSGPNAFRKITSQEARRHYEKGLYYYYDERFIPGYRCQRPQMFMIWDMDDINEET